MTSASSTLMTSSCASRTKPDFLPLFVHKWQASARSVVVFSSTD
jgi:hypothetical protein